MDLFSQIFNDYGWTTLGFCGKIAEKASLERFDRVLKTPLNNQKLLKVINNNNEVNIKTPERRQLIIINFALLLFTKLNQLK